MARTLLFCRILSNALGKHIFASKDAPGKQAQYADLNRTGKSEIFRQVSKLIHIKSRKPRERNFFSHARSPLRRDLPPIAS